MTDNIEKNIILAGVGGQGILIQANVVNYTALKQGLNINQSEIHGIAQRSGSVYAHLRYSNKEIHSDLIPKGKADIIIGVEPLEALRYVEYLKPSGWIITNTTPIKTVEYDVEKILETIISYDRSIVINADEIAKEAGNIKASNIVMLGAASPYLGLDEVILKNSIKELFSEKGKHIVNANLKAFEMGKEAAILPKPL